MARGSDRQLTALTLPSPLRPGPATRAGGADSSRAGGGGRPPLRRLPRPLGPAAKPGALGLTARPSTGPVGKKRPDRAPFLAFRLPTQIHLPAFSWLKR